MLAVIRNAASQRQVLESIILPLLFRDRPQLPHGDHILLSSHCLLCLNERLDRSTPAKPPTTTKSMPASHRRSINRFSCTT
jgi:hypothetical protein